MRLEVGALRDRLGLHDALRLGEDIGVRDRADVLGALEVGARRDLLADLLLEPLVVEVEAVEPVQDVQQPVHRVVHAPVDGAEHDKALLDARHGRADGHVALHVGQVVQRGTHDALAGIDDELEQREQRRRRAVERHRHRDLADVVDREAALDLQHLAGLRRALLAADLATLELERGRRVLDVRGVEKRPQRAGGRAGQAPDHVRQADAVGAAPRDERELDEVLKLLLRRVVLHPVAVDGQDARRGEVDRHDVGRRAVLGLDVRDREDLVDGPQAILVVAGVVAPLDLVVGLGCRRHVGLHAGTADVEVAVHAVGDAAVELDLGQVLDVRAALGRVEVGGREGQVHFVDADEQELGPVASLVPRDLEVLVAAQRHLRHKLLKLGAELLALLGELPVHQLDLAARLGDLRLGQLARHVVLDRPAAREKLLHHARREVDAALDEHGMHRLGRALELRAAGRVVGQPGAAQPLGVQLVALLARVLVDLDQVEQRRGEGRGGALRQCLGKVREPLADGGVLRLVALKIEEDAAVLQLDRCRVLDFTLDGDALALGNVVVLVHRRLEPLPLWCAGCCYTSSFSQWQLAVESAANAVKESFPVDRAAGQRARELAPVPARAIALRRHGRVGVGLHAAGLLHLAMLAGARGSALEARCCHAARASR